MSGFEAAQAALRARGLVIVNLRTTLEPGVSIGAPTVQRVRIVVAQEPRSGNYMAYEWTLEGDGATALEAAQNAMGAEPESGE